MFSIIDPSIKQKNYNDSLKQKRFLKGIPYNGVIIQK